MILKNKKIVFQPNEGQKNVFQPDIEICFRQEPMSREQLKKLLGVIDLNDYRRFEALKIVGLEALNHLVT